LPRIGTTFVKSMPTPFPARQDREGKNRSVGQELREKKEEDSVITAAPRRRVADRKISNGSGNRSEKRVAKTETRFGASNHGRRWAIKGRKLRTVRVSLSSATTLDKKTHIAELQQQRRGRNIAGGGDLSWGG